MGEFVVSARKYRPVSFNSVVGQPAVTNTLKNAIRSGQIAHAYLFCGPRGVGKTTCARIMARTLNCSNLTDQVEACGKCASCLAFAESRSFNIHELDAASNNSVEDIRSLIEKVRILPQVGRYSIYIIDEVHMLSQSAFNAFLKTLEEPPPHAIFILATTEKQKILPTIMSRCQVFDFNRIRVEDMITHMVGIADHENIRYEPEALHVIAVKADGALRDALSLFDQAASFSGNNITYAEVADNLNVLDYEYYFKLTEAFLRHSTTDSLLLYNEILLKGFDSLNFINGLSKHLRDLLVSHHNETLQLLETSEILKEKYRQQALKCTPSFLIKALEICSQCEVSYRSSKNQRLHIELALLQVCNINDEKKNLNEKKGHLSIPDVGSAKENKNKTVDIAKSNPVHVETDTSQGKSTTTLHDPEKEYNSVAQGISIKNALQSMNGDRDDEEQHERFEDPAIPDNGTDLKPISEEFLLMCWNAFADQIKKNKPRMAVALRSTLPRIFDGTVIGITLSNQAQLEDFNQNTKGELEKFLRREMKNAAIIVDPAVDKTPDDQKVKLYTNDEKFEYLNKKNPLLSKLKEKLNLELE